MRFRVSGTDKVRISQRQERTRKVGSAFIGRFLESETDNAEEACRQFSEKHAANGENRCRSKVLLQENQVNDIRSTHPGKLFQ